MTLAYDPGDPAVIADPYPILKRLQEEAPVHWCAPLKGWVLTRYDHVRDGLKSAHLSAERVQAFARQLPADSQAEFADLSRILGHWAVFRDPPAHTRLRRLMSPWFGARGFEPLRPRVQEIVDELIDGVAESGATDLVRDVAFPLPVAVIGEIMGVPPSDVELFKAWSDELAVFVGRASGTPGKLARAQDAVREMEAYFRDLIAARRARPRDDVVSRLIAAEERGSILSEDELTANCVLLLFAGHETTTNLIANGVLALLRHPAELRRLRAEPALTVSAVDELLRYDGPGGAAARVVKQPLEIGGQRLAAGERVFLMVNAANRDPRRFESPERLDLGRDPNPHLAFGFGIHFCLGAPLARLEAQAAIATLVRRLPGLALAGEDLEWRDGLVLRGMTSLPLRFDASHPARLGAAGGARQGGA